MKHSVVQLLTENPHLLEPIVDQRDPWAGTPYAGYLACSNSTKGMEFGEPVIAKYMETYLDSSVNRDRSSSDDHDMMIDSYRVECKFGLAQVQKKKMGAILPLVDNFTFNHFAKCKKWDRAIVFGINREEHLNRLMWFKKEDWVYYIENINEHENAFSVGQKEADDYMVHGPRQVERLRRQSWVYDIND